MFEYTPVSQEDQKHTSLDVTDYVRVWYNEPTPVLKGPPRPCFVTERFKGFDQAIKDFQVRPDDIYVLSYPKTGTTMMSELCTVLASGLDFERMEKDSLMVRSPYLELSAMMNTPVDFYEIAKSTPTTTRRVIKSHLPVNLLPNEMLTLSDHKMIYTVRNPKDAVVSAFHHYKNIHGYVGSFTDLIDGYLKGDLIYGSYFHHVDEYLRLAKVKKNILIVTYEEMVTDLAKVVQKVAEFLKIPLSETDVQKVADYVHFDNMKERKSSNFQDFAEAASSMASGTVTDFRFLRKGKKDSHKEEMTPEHIELFNAEIKKWTNLMQLCPNY